MKRNHFLVGNTTYFNSSIKSSNSLMIVKPESNKTAQVYNNYKDTYMKVSNRLSVFTIAKHTEINVFDNIKDDIQFSIINTTINNLDRTTFDYNNDKANFHISDRTCHAITCFSIEKPDLYQEMASVTLIVKDDRKEQNYYDQEYYGKEFDVVKDNSHNIIVKTNSSRAIVRDITDRIKGKWTDYSVAPFEAKSITQMVYSEELTKYNALDSLAIVIENYDGAAGYESCNLISIDVTNKSAGITEDAASSGGELKRLDFTVQQMSFFKFKLSFENKHVVDVTNLPKGLFFDKEGQRIIGTPMLSGKTTFTVIFNDNTQLNGSIDVPRLKREL